MSSRISEFVKKRFAEYTHLAISNASFAPFNRPKIASAGPRSHQRQTLRRLLASKLDKPSNITTLLTHQPQRFLDPSSLRNHGLAAVNLQRIYQATRSPSSRRCFTSVGVDTRYVCRFEPRERVGRTDNGYTGLKPTTRLTALRAFYVTDYTVQVSELSIFRRKFDLRSRWLCLPIDYEHRSGDTTPIKEVKASVLPRRGLSLCASFVTLHLVIADTRRPSMSASL
ncbi:hypothetical protein BDN70DRAFT_615814 [Pholiota conissans]|uniref:Uncharacterized protein n=1 Tax=Pholiota conissans TaxID=109636 RepID=A0A9P5Z2U0_9AGAR|nr:hypothetical protein BDN70DRAFT_615814 [Pholiota conissans]